MLRRIYTPVLGICIFALLAFGALWSPSAAAQATCANVRCASGTCIDTPAGPTCTQALTCASTLCEVGSRCEERSTGPVCVPNVSTPAYGHHPRPKVKQPYFRPDRYVKHPYVKRPYYQPTPTPNKCRTYRDSYRGYSYYRRDCQARPPVNNPPVYSPPNPRPRICTKEYRPVCAEKTVQCFRAPCPSVKQTFGNACMAQAEGYNVIRQGTCR